MSEIDVDEVLEHQLDANMHLMPYEVYSELFDSIGMLGNERDQLKAENIKLRELVKDMKAYICKMYHDEPCAVTCGAYDEMLGICVYGKRMSELGIEGK